MNFRRNLLFKLYKLSDICILITALLITFYITSYPSELIPFKEILTLRIRLINFIWLLVMIFIWYSVFTLSNLYRSRRLESEILVARDIFIATFLGTVIYFICSLFLGITDAPLYFWSVFWLASATLTIFFRVVLLKTFLEKVRLRGRNLNSVIIVGTNRRAYEFAKMLTDKKELGCQVIGFVDQSLHDPQEDINILGTLDNISEILSNNVVDEIIIALPIKSFYDNIQQVVQAAEEQGVPTRFLSHLFDTKIASLNIDFLDDFSTLKISSGPHESWQYSVKRMLDIVFSIILIVIFLPVMLLAAVAILIDSPGPILYKQLRIGKNKRIFQLYKFRTMVVNAENMQAELEKYNEMDGPVFKIHRDPRVIKVGRWLRAFSIDELPQLFNVLIGEMSLVGPRPLPVRDYSGFDQNWQRRRFSVSPGITCTWQVNGRNNVSFEKWMKMDMEYIDKWSLSLDIMILLKTLPAVLKRHGAS